MVKNVIVCSRVIFGLVPIVRDVPVKCIFTGIIRIFYVRRGLILYVVGKGVAHVQKCTLILQN